MRRVLLPALLSVVVAAVPAGAAGTGGTGAPEPQIQCASDAAEARDLDLVVDGQPAHGLYATPRGRAKGLVAFFHGYGHTSESWRAHMVRVAQQEGVIAFAMDYRGTVITPPAKPGGLPTSRGWQVAEGAADSIVAAQTLLGRCPVDGPVIAYGVSMGGNASGLAVAAKPTRPGTAGSLLWDHWVNVEGATNVLEIYAGAAALSASGNATAVNAKADIERQMGGTPAEQRDRYLQRTVVARAADVAAGLRFGVVSVHGVDDGLVPTNQSVEMKAALRRHGVPVDSTTVLTREASSEPGTTATGYLPIPGYTSPFAGHASETSLTHTVGKEGFAALTALVRGYLPGCRDTVLDGSTGTRQRTTGLC